MKDMKEYLVKSYEMTTGAQGYLYGFVQNHNLYYVLTAGLIDEALKLDRESSKRGGRFKIRIRFSSAMRKAMIATGKAVLLGSENLLDTNDKYNKGERFERIITESLTGERWEKDSKPYWECGDVRLNGKEIQVKFDGAELTNESAVEKGLAAKAA